jgi:lipid A 3-O-deacylase
MILLVRKEPSPIAGSKAARWNTPSRAPREFVRWTLIAVAALLATSSFPVTAREDHAATDSGNDAPVESPAVTETDALQKRLRDRPVRYRPNWRFEFSNDVFLGSDNFFSAGWSLQMHGARVDSWDNARDTPAFGRSLARLFLPEQAADRSFRESWGFGQVISTPEDIDSEELLENDIQYSSLLAVTNGWIAFNDTQFTGFQWLLGVVGPAAQGEEVQKIVHALVKSPEPQGWDNQLGNEPILNFTYMMKRKLINLKSFDFAVNGGAALGNWFSNVDASIELRIGKNKPGGFLYIPDPVGRSMFYDAALPLADKSKRYTFYASAVLRATYMAHMLILDGSTFSESPSLKDEREPFVGQMILGLHYRRYRWGIHTNWWFTTDFIRSGGMIEGDRAVDFGTITLEYRF